MPPPEKNFPSGRMFPFDFLCRSESARQALEKFNVRIWDDGHWAFWRADGTYTKKAAEADVLDFPYAFAIANKHGSPTKLLFDPVIPEHEEEFKSRWQNLLNVVGREAAQPATKPDPKTGI
jgi:hypothetical protein